MNEFSIGQRVFIHDAGHSYPNYKIMAESMNLKGWVKWRDAPTGVALRIVAILPHKNFTKGLLYGLESIDGSSSSSGGGEKQSYIVHEDGIVCVNTTYLCSDD